MRFLQRFFKFDRFVSGNRATPSRVEVLAEYCIEDLEDPESELCRFLRSTTVADGIASGIEQAWGDSESSPAGPAPSEIPAMA